MSQFCGPSQSVETRGGVLSKMLVPNRNCRVQRRYRDYPYEQCVLKVKRQWGYYVLNFCIPSIIVAFVGAFGI